MKVGDKVVIRRAYRTNRQSSWTHHMDCLIGKEVTIKQLSDDCFYPKECRNGYHYPIECLESDMILEPTYEIY